MRMASKITCFLLFTARGKLSALLEKRNTSVCLHFQTALSTRMLFLTLSQNQFPCNFHSLFNTEQAWTSLLHNSLEQIRNSIRDAMFLLIFLLLGLHVPSAPMGPHFFLLVCCSSNPIYKVLWTLSHILLKVKSNVHSVWQASLTAHSIQKGTG